MALCVAALGDDGADILECHSGREGMTEIILKWIAQETPVLLTLDTPLGWPTDLTTILSSHQAGLPLRLKPGALFYRECDRMIKSNFGIGNKPIGADKVAFNTYSALTFLDHIGYKQGMRIPLVWDQFLQYPAQVIEVSPRATLSSLSLPYDKIKGLSMEAEDCRNSILHGITDWVNTGEYYEQVLTSPPLMLAALGVLAGHDFLRMTTVEPQDMYTAKKEGWIWVREKPLAASSATQLPE